MKFSTKLILLFSGIILIIGTVISYLVYTSNISTLENHIKDRLKNQAFHTMDKIDRMLFERYADIKVLASDQVMSSRDSTPQQITRRLLEYKSNYKAYASLSFFNLKRIRIADTEGKDIGGQHSLSEYWKGLADGKEIVVEISSSESLNQIVFHSASLVKDKKGMPFGVVVSRVPVENLYDTIRQSVGIYDVERDFKIELVDKGGLVLYANYNREGILKEVSHHWRTIKDYLAEGINVGEVKYINPQESEEILAFAREQGYLDFKGSGWTLIIEIPAKVAFVSAVELRNRIIGILFITGLSALAIIFFSARRVSQTIERISRASVEVAQGNLDVRVEASSKGEIGRLAWSFNEMAADLKEYQDLLLAHSRELEITVAARTAGLRQANEQLQNELAERKQAEYRYRLLLETLPHGVEECDATGTITFSNAMHHHIRGYDEGKIVGMKIWDLLDSEAERQELKTYLSKLVSEQPAPVPYFSKIRNKKDGRLVSAQVDWNYKRDKEGNVIGFVSVITDITERKEAEEKLKARERQQAIVAELGLRALVGIDINVLMNESVALLAENLKVEHCKILELLPDGKNLLLRSGVGWKDGLVGHATVGAGKDSQAGFTLISDGPVIVEDLRTETRFSSPPLLTDHGVISGMSVIITGWERPFGVLGVHTTQQRKFSMDDIHFLQSIANVLVSAIERHRTEKELLKTGKFESLGVLAGGIAHDFNNLLTGIIGNISLAKTFARPEEKIYEILERSEKACFRATDLTTQLITFAKGGAPIKKIVFISDLIKDSVSFALSGSHIKCEFSMQDDLWPVEVDEGQIRQVISNLIVNAEEAMPEGGVVKVRAENITIGTKDTLLLKEGKYIRVFIEDQGIGIPKELLGKIFDPYFTTKQKGSGLGLSTAYSIIHKHAGVITVESALGVGTTFCIYLPASKKIAARKASTHEEASIIRQGKILVMDDEEMVRELARELWSIIGYEVGLAKDGKEAIELYSKAKEVGKPFDIVMLDLTIPGGMGGRETIKRLLEIDPDVKAIVASGYSNDPIMADCKAYGFISAVTKPYNIEELRKLVGEIIDGNVE